LSDDTTLLSVCADPPLFAEALELPAVEELLSLLLLLSEWSLLSTLAVLFVPLTAAFPLPLSLTSASLLSEWSLLSTATVEPLSAEPLWSVAFTDLLLFWSLLLLLSTDDVEPLLADALELSAVEVLLLLFWSLLSTDDVDPLFAAATTPAAPSWPGPYPPTVTVSFVALTVEPLFAAIPLVSAVALTLLLLLF